jgi:hypothetical protein
VSAGWVFGPDVGLDDAGWMSQEEYQERLNPPTQIIMPVEHRVGVAWRVARSLDTLLGQLNAAAPRRSKASDGSIGDAAHASRDSDHNPWYGPGVVTARDFTHDPAGGLDCQWLANALVAAKDSRVKYVIYNRRICDSRPGNNPWVWMPYSGTNPHTKHLHLSVMDNASCDDTRGWSLSGVAPLAPARSQVDTSSVWARREKPWPGGITNIPDPINGEEYDLFQTVKRNNVEIYQGNLMLEQLLAQVQALRAEVAVLRQRLGDG